MTATGYYIFMSMDNDVLHMITYFSFSFFNQRLKVQAKMDH